MSKISSKGSAQNRRPKTVEPKPTTLRRLTVALFHMRKYSPFSISALPCERYLLLAVIPYMQAR